MTLQQHQQQQQHGDIFTAEQLLGKRRKKVGYQYIGYAAAVCDAEHGFLYMTWA